jgi:hypothetical protein
MSTRIEDAFDRCWAALLQDESLESCLSRYPELSAELRPLLMAAIEAHKPWDVPVSRERALRSRTRLLGRASELRRSAPARRPQTSIPRLAAIGIALVLVFIFGSTGLVVASAESLPGESLYPVKRAVEQVRLSLSLGSSSQLSLASSFDKRRVEEVKRLLVLRRVARVQFEGRLESISGGFFTVDGVLVLPSPGAQLTADLRPGDFVSVAGNTHPSGWVLAASVQRTGQQFVGVVEAMNANVWTISGRAVRLAPDTQIDNGIGIGDQVAVQIHNEAGMTVVASIHLLEKGQNHPAATALPLVATPSDTPQPQIAPTETRESEQETPAPEADGSETITFSGKVESKGQGNWSISGENVAVTSRTEIDGAIGIGDTVEVQGTRLADGTLQAQRIRLIDSGGDGSGDDRGEEIEFSGRIDSIASDQWVVDGRTVGIDSETDIEGAPEVGDRAQVKAVTYSDGSLLARKIERKDSGSEGESSPTPEGDD